MTGPQELSVFLQLVQTGSQVAILAFFLLAFYRGDIVSKIVLDKILERYSKQFEEMTERVLQAIKESSKPSGW